MAVALVGCLERGSSTSALACASQSLQPSVATTVNSTTTHAHSQSWLLQVLNVDFLLYNATSISKNYNFILIYLSVKMAEFFSFMGLWAPPYLHCRTPIVCAPHGTAVFQPQYLRTWFSALFYFCYKIKILLVKAKSILYANDTQFLNISH